MNKSLDDLSVLPDSWQCQILASYSDEYLIEKLSDYISMMNIVIDSGRYDLLEKLRNGEVMSLNQLKDTSERMKKYMNDVLDWQKAAGFSVDKSGVIPWMEMQYDFYESEVNEFKGAKNDQDKIDGVFDVCWTSFNFFLGNEHKLEKAINTEVGINMKPLSEQIKRKIEQRKSFVVLKLAVRHIHKMQSFCEVQGWDFDKMWSIGSKSNWAKFASKKSDVEASQKYYQEKIGVKTKFDKVGKVWVLRVDGLQTVNGKEYNDNKIMKCGKVFKGSFVPWIEPDWAEALESGKL